MHEKEKTNKSEQNTKKTQHPKRTSRKNILNYHVCLNSTSLKSH